MEASRQLSLVEHDPYESPSRIEDFETRSSGSGCVEGKDCVPAARVGSEEHRAPHQDGVQRTVPPNVPPPTEEPLILTWIVLGVWNVGEEALQVRPREACGQVPEAIPVGISTAQIIGEEVDSRVLRMYSTVEGMIRSTSKLLGSMCTHTWPVPGPRRTVFSSPCVNTRAPNTPPLTESDITAESIPAGLSEGRVVAIRVTLYCPPWPT